jgi:hypothetical protein
MHPDSVMCRDGSKPIGQPCREAALTEAFRSFPGRAWGGERAHRNSANTRTVGGMMAW